MNKSLTLISLCMLLTFGCKKEAVEESKEPTSLKDVNSVLSKDILKDKIKGGWAGQVIGVTFGGPTEFKFNGTYIQDYQKIPWYDGYMKEWYINSPGLYDDVYMDLTFVDVFERVGLDAPVDSFATAYAKAGYMLWHANQAGRYNILKGIMPPASGHWLNNPHADCIDYQIEADFSGLMTPGMPNTSAEIGDKIGHIMNYGDGWYGGIYVGALYSLAFVSDDIPFVVTEALKTIPTESEFYQCIKDVIAWHKQYPDDWKSTWFEIQKKWSEDIGCPDGVFHAFNIDAKVNAAYVVVGLLYGEGDFTKTLEISTRCGQDSDCNPATAGGILGTMYGYSKIPSFWQQGLAEVEPMDFKYTTVSLNDVYEISYKHAVAMIERNGGKVTEKEVSIKLQEPQPVKFEKSFEGHFPSKKLSVNKKLENEYEFSFDGIGFIMRGAANKKRDITEEYEFMAELYIDGEKIETVSLPTDYSKRRHELFWKYQLSAGNHEVKIKLLNPSQQHEVHLNDILFYTDGSKQTVALK